MDPVDPVDADDDNEEEALVFMTVAAELMEPPALS
jgi:hypothetical protein